MNICKIPNKYINSNLTLIQNTKIQKEFDIPLFFTVFLFFRISLPFFDDIKKKITLRNNFITIPPITKIMQSSLIPLTAKKSHYGVNGTGRDTYINFDNGGNYRGFIQLGIGKF